MNSEKIKEQVRERYTAAVTEGTSCCGGSVAARPSCCGSTEPSETGLPADRVVAAAGYSSQELASLPKDAVVNSFGCGNPLAFAGVQPGETVLDIGSGAGIDCLLAAQKVGPKGRVIGIDMTPVMIEKARENARKAGASNVEFRLGDAENMPVEDTSLDWIVSNCVINLAPDKPREAFRVLKPGGKLSVSDIMVEKLPPMLRDSTALYCSCVAGAIPEAVYLNQMREAGFTDVHVTDRIVYDRDQILGLMREVLNVPDNMKPWVESLVDRHIVGKVWSAKVVATKPGTH